MWLADMWSSVIQPDVIVDRTHMRRRSSGIERLTDMLFSADALAPLQVGTAESSHHRPSIVFHQMLINPLSALWRSEPAWIFPGYPPSPVFALLRERSVLYVHDLFLMTRRRDLNWAARLYAAPAFRYAVTRLQYFLVNSVTTQQRLQPYVRADADVRLYRPSVPNVFNLRAADWERSATASLVVGALGTIEPRKNFLASARICQVLSQILQRPVELHIIGRAGWGGDADHLASMPNVRLHGALTDDAASRVIRDFDLFLCTSHDEGLGLPLLEMQYAGLPVIAPDQDVFREVLGASGTYIIPDAPDRAGAAIAAFVQRPDWRSAAVSQAQANVKRWNNQADADRLNVIEFLRELTGRLQKCRKS